MKLSNLKTIQKSVLSIALLFFAASIATVGSTLPAAADPIDTTCAYYKSWNDTKTILVPAGQRFCIQDGFWPYDTQTGKHLTWQSNGNLVAFDRVGNVLWSTGTWNGGKTLELTKYGSIAVLNKSGAVMWENNYWQHYIPHATYTITVLSDGISEGSTFADGTHGVPWFQPYN